MVLGWRGVQVVCHFCVRCQKPNHKKKEKKEKGTKKTNSVWHCGIKPTAGGQVARVWIVSNLPRPPPPPLLYSLSSASSFPGTLLSYLTFKSSFVDYVVTFNKLCVGSGRFVVWFCYFEWDKGFCFWLHFLGWNEIYVFIEKWKRTVFYLLFWLLMIFAGLWHIFR